LKEEVQEVLEDLKDELKQLVLTTAFLMSLLEEGKEQVTVLKLVVVALILVIVTVVLCKAI
jgi:hypothetical protein